MNFKEWLVEYEVDPFDNIAADDGTAMDIFQGQIDIKKTDALKRAISVRPNDFLSSILSQVEQGVILTEPQKKSVRHNFYELGMKEDANLFK